MFVWYFRPIGALLGPIWQFLGLFWPILAKYRENGQILTAIFFENRSKNIFFGKIWESLNTIRIGAIQVLRYHFLTIFLPPPPCYHPVTIGLPPPVVTLPPSTLRNLIPKGQFIKNMCIFMFFCKVL